MDERRWPEALEHLEAAVAVNGYCADWHVFLGRVLDELGRHDDAIAACERALLIEPDHLHGLNHLGVSLHHVGRHKEAIRAFQKAEELDPTFEPAYCNRIRPYAELGDHQMAEEMFYTARLYREQCPACYFNIAHSLIARGLHDRAIYCLNKTIDLAGDDVRVRAKLGETLRQRGLLEQARRHYLQGLRLSPDDAAVTLDYVSLLVQMRRFDEADAKLAHLADRAPASAGWSAAKGAVLLGRKRLDDAAESLKTALRLDPTFAGANLLLAQIAVKQDRIPDAKTFLRAELLLRPGAGQILLDLANMLIDVSELRPAVACLRRLTAAEPRNAKAWQNLAVAECLRGRHHRGIDAGYEALDIDPGSVAVRHNLVLALLDLGELKRAHAELSAAFALSPRDRNLKKLKLRLLIAKPILAAKRLLKRW
ncbi:MAG: tetratricopeptide repeat protein [Tepidisphaeraceae bacterium]